ncbi:MAG: hypothetical protein J6Z43_11015 [Clostridiales bacterium]|nr:hypothetical protein [Clostridiales bacterium]
MKKPSKKGVTAAKIIAGLAATVTLGCNVNGCGVYGPPQPPETTDDPQETVITSEEDDTDVTKNNMNEDVYGPPEDFEPSDNEMDCVYGPPEDMQ